MNYGLRNFWFQVVDANERVITSGLTINILSTAGAILTVYSDNKKTALTNPVTETAYDALGDGIIRFWTGVANVDIEILDEEGRVARFNDFSRGEHMLKFDPNRIEGQLLFANKAAGAELVDSAGAFVAYPHTYTLDGAKLHIGDVIRIKGTVLAADFNADEELNIKVLFGTEALLTTGDVVIVANDDTITFDLEVTVETLGATGTIKTVGKWETDLNGTVVNYIVAPGGAAKAGVTEDISGDIVIQVQGDYQTAAEDQESYLIDFKVFKYAQAYHA